MNSAHVASADEDNPDRAGGARFGKGYITTRQAADILGVNRATIINWARQGRFNAIQYGARGIYRFDRAEIVDFLNRSRLQNAASEPGGQADSSL